jgi:hypothetical protein
MTYDMGDLHFENILDLEMWIRDTEEQISM